MSCLTVLGVEMQAVQVLAQRHQLNNGNLLLRLSIDTQLRIQVGAIDAAVPVWI